MAHQNTRHISFNSGSTSNSSSYNETENLYRLHSNITSDVRVSGRSAATLAIDLRGKFRLKVYVAVLIAASPFDHFIYNQQINSFIQKKNEQLLQAVIDEFQCSKLFQFGDSFLTNLSSYQIPFSSF